MESFDLDSLAVSMPQGPSRSTNASMDSSAMNSVAKRKSPDTPMEEPLAKKPAPQQNQSHNGMDQGRERVLIKETSSFSDFLVEDPMDAYLRCCNYEICSTAFDTFAEALENGTCKPNFIFRFISTCVQKLTRWVMPDGTTATVGLFLEFFKKMSHAFREKGYTHECFEYYIHPVYNCVLEGSLDNIPLMLRYGLELEYTEKLYDHELDYFKRNMILFSKRSWLKKMRQLPNKKRVFLVLLVIKTYYYSAKKDRKWRSMDEINKALMMIWRAMPDLYLCRREIFEVLALVPALAPAKSDMLQIISENYKIVCNGDFTEHAQPRSLAHLSCCKIRHVMNIKKELPNGVNTLPIPMKLKKYVWLE